MLESFLIDATDLLPSLKTLSLAPAPYAPPMISDIIVLTMTA